MAGRDNQDSLFFKIFEPRPRKADLRRAAIVRATIDCIAKTGIEGTTLEVIGKSIGLHRSHVAYYYKEKKEIIEAAIRLITLTAQEMTIERIKKARGGKEQVLAMVEGAFDWGQTHPRQVSVLLLFYHYCTYDRSYRDLMREIRLAGRERMQRIFESFVKDAKTRARIPDLCVTIQATVLGRIFECFATGETDAIAQHRRIALANVRDLAAGLLD